MVGSHQSRLCKNAGAAAKDPVSRARFGSTSSHTSSEDLKVVAFLRLGDDAMMESRRRFRRQVAGFL